MVTQLTQSVQCRDAAQRRDDRPQDRLLPGINIEVYPDERALVRQAKMLRRRARRDLPRVVMQALGRVGRSAGEGQARARVSPRVAGTPHGARRARLGPPRPPARGPATREARGSPGGARRRCCTLTW